jgi:hypothetical protein
LLAEDVEGVSSTSDDSSSSSSEDSSTGCCFLEEDLLAEDDGADLPLALSAAPEAIRTSAIPAVAEEAADAVAPVLEADSDMIRIGKL